MDKQKRTENPKHKPWFPNETDNISVFVFNASLRAIVPASPIWFSFKNKTCFLNKTSDSPIQRLKIPARWMIFNAMFVFNASPNATAPLSPMLFADCVLNKKNMDSLPKKNHFAVNKPMRPRWKSLVFVFSASLNAHAPPSPIVFSIKSFITKKQMTWGTKLTCQNNVPKSVIDFQCIAQLDCCQIVNEILCVLNKLNNQRCGRNKKKLWFKTSQFEFQKRCVCFKCTCQHCNFWTPNVWICVKHIVWLMKTKHNKRKTRREWQTRKIKFSKCFVEL